MDKIIDQSHSLRQCDFFIKPTSILTPLGFLCVFITYLGLLVTGIN